MTSRPAASLVIVISLALGACSSSASLGGKPAKPVPKDANEAEPSGELGQEKPGNEAPKQEDATVADDEEDLKVIPPEVVSGAYLTCPKTIEPAVTDDQKISFGCSAETKGGRIDLEGFKKDWMIFQFFSGVPMRLPLSPVLTQDDTKIDVDWDLSAAQFRAGVFARVVLHGKDGTTATLDSKHPTIVNGVASYE